MSTVPEVDNPTIISNGSSLYRHYTVVTDKEIALTNNSFKTLQKMMARGIYPKHLLISIYLYLYFIYLYFILYYIIHYNQNLKIIG